MGFPPGITLALAGITLAHLGLAFGLLWDQLAASPDYLGITLGSLLSHLGITPGSKGDHSGIPLGSLCRQLGIPSFWDYYWVDF